ncbi:formimidoylglutamase [Cytophagales bacterium LB-30]|uniref:Formimidoylglutamase n=1 Tax=Shiella aurantiaca TaxID=3058365 RepID=A0ABT8F5F4_9BACT|nr:formimidoylglutamase [Shiella aurantiaca]MDN4165685.1 formimidoylglutamase [Shiella aurantiaca]
MDIKIFFNSIDESLIGAELPHDSFLKNCKVNFGLMPDYQGADIALIGLPHPEGASMALRKKLYSLKKGTGAYKIVDLGNIREGHDAEETHNRVREVCETLLSQNVLPMLIGGTHDYSYAQYRAYESMDKLISVMAIDAFLDMEDAEISAPNHCHTQKLLLHQPNYLFNYCHLAYQSYLVNPVETSVLERLYFETYRLGQIRENMHEMEPVIRNVDMLSFDITAIKMSDAPGTERAQPFGLTGEEACQICWYAGLNEKLSALGFYEYDPAFDDARGRTASVVATMIWYFIEGFYHRKNDKGFKSNDYIRYVVSMQKDPATMVFYKSIFTEKWWLEVPYPFEKNKYARNCIVPCSYSDYETALKGQLPERWLQTYAKLI